MADDSVADGSVLVHRTQILRRLSMVLLAPGVRVLDSMTVRSVVPLCSVNLQSLLPHIVVIEALMATGTRLRSVS